VRNVSVAPLCCVGSNGHIRLKAVKRNVAKRPFADINVRTNRRHAPVRTNNEESAGPSG